MEKTIRRIEASIQIHVAADERENFREKFINTQLYKIDKYYKNKYPYIEFLTEWEFESKRHPVITREDGSAFIDENQWRYIFARKAKY